MFTAKVKKGLWRKTYKNVRGDLCYETKNGQPLPVRVLILSDETRVELPMNSTIIEFSPQRAYDIKANMESETGQTMKMKRGVMEKK